MNIELSETNRTDDVKSIKKKVGYRRKLGKTIAMCIGIDGSLTEVSRIIPTLKGAIIHVLFYSLQRENERTGNVEDRDPLISLKNRSKSWDSLRSGHGEKAMPKQALSVPLFVYDSLPSLSSPGNCMPALNISKTFPIQSVSACSNIWSPYHFFLFFECPKWRPKKSLVW